MVFHGSAATRSRDAHGNAYIHTCTSMAMAKVVTTISTPGFAFSCVVIGVTSELKVLKVLKKSDAVLFSISWENLKVLARRI